MKRNDLQNNSTKTFNMGIRDSLSGVPRGPIAPRVGQFQNL